MSKAQGKFDFSVHHPFKASSWNHNSNKEPLFLRVSLEYQKWFLYGLV